MCLAYILYAIAGIIAAIVLIVGVIIVIFHDK